jgi:hypothetical protein
MKLTGCTPAVGFKIKSAFPEFSEGGIFMFKFTEDFSKVGYDETGSTRNPVN